ncbi:Nitrogen assimilation transcription factor nit-4 [Colletotrichum fructicola Nara gc5]|uniref:Nitrogen assimilation transcription factor nit-4 n=1 Tax=Colletotrichum fructicola (strain Nara gc5) TaxID=1213859 RepID=A0A7J6J604_COLFN|nr:Nitrogen assimilation transcription factor nit-4 [Colletotrichum fructicola]KAF4485252.1 Nitrogen assimilation transcription factor nit-4 [Colletotrichum fructicola Nara gc5]
MSSQEGPVRSDSENQTKGQSTLGLRRLLPAAASTAGPSRGPTSASPDYSIRPLRHQVPAACLQCRKRKVKCSGARPSCHRCLQNDVDCKWDTEPDTSRLVSIRKRKEELERENEDLHEFLRFLISRPEEEAFEIFKRLRASGDALEVLNFVRTADLLLQRRQRGRPSHLITSFFLWEAPFFLPFVDQQTFLDDMRGCSPEMATYCSPLLVHAICALRSHTSERAETFGRANGCDLRMLFLNEARRQWELERGEALLTTAQALFIMYLTTLALGMETSATEYQLAACDMAHTLQSEVKGSLGTNDRDERAASKALWGMYCFESISAFSYLRPSALSKPPNFRHFFDGDTRHAAKLPDEECRVTMIRNAMVLEATCDLSATFNDIMEYNCGMVEYQMNIDDDFRIRRQFATLLSQLGSENHKLGSKEDSDLHGLYFRAYECQVAVAILRPLKPETPFPADDTVADLLFAQCERSIEGIEDHDRAYSVRVAEPVC